MTQTTQPGPARWGELTKEQRRKVNQYITTLLAQPTELPAILKPGRDLLELRRGDGVNYQLERVKCGKVNCKCVKGLLHGPYWYAYYRKGKRTVSQYLGREWREFTPPKEAKS